MEVWVKVGVMEGVRVKVAVSVGGGGVAVWVAVGVEGLKPNPLHPASRAANKMMMDIRYFIFSLYKSKRRIVPQSAAAATYGLTTESTENTEFLQGDSL
jgi:hypothetical protein